MNPWQHLSDDEFLALCQRHSLTTAKLLETLAVLRNVGSALHVEACRRVAVASAVPGEVDKALRDIASRQP